MDKITINLDPYENDELLSQYARTQRALDYLSRKADEKYEKTQAWEAIEERVVIATMIFALGAMAAMIVVCEFMA